MEGTDSTVPERRMRDILDDLDLEYEDEFKVGKRTVEVGPRKHKAFKADFRLPPGANDIQFDVLIEVEGEYPHPDANPEIPDPEEMDKTQKYNFWKDMRKEDRYDVEGYRHVRVPGKAVEHRPGIVKRRLRDLLGGDDPRTGLWLVHPTEPYPKD